MPTAIVAAGLAGFLFRFFSGEHGESWIHTVEDQGWFHANSYKKTQGHKARRYTLIGLIVIFWSGAYSLHSHQSLGTGSWSITIPITGEPKTVVTILTNVDYPADSLPGPVPLILAALSFWVCWRLVNVPSFSDFLIATEAEMNKVSWSTRKRLVQDTVVVLVTTALLTSFLLVVDLFWGWALSREVVKILPTRSQEAAKVDPLQGRKVDW